MSKSLMSRTLQWGFAQKFCTAIISFNRVGEIKGRCRVICIKVKDMATFQKIIVKKKLMLSLNDMTEVIMDLRLNFHYPLYFCTKKK